MGVPGGEATGRALTRVLDGERIFPPPVWLMRQAGRYLPEYRQTRAKVSSFLELCYTPRLAAEVTLQPVRRFGLDAAILFSDILVVPHALGRNVRFVEGEGPRLDPIDARGIARLDNSGVVERLAPVLETVSLVRAALPAETALIGFCGAPWTVATYMIAGAGTPDQTPARLFAYREAEAFSALIDTLTEASIRYLAAQLEAGADAVQIFDTWAGVLAEEFFEAWVMRPTARIVEQVRAVRPGARVIGFPRGAGARLPDYVKTTKVDGVGLDWTVPLGFAREAVQPLAAVQGNLDPLLMVAGGAALDAGVDRILAGLGGGRLIFNLGHGITPDADPANVARLVARIRMRNYTGGTA